MTRLPLSTLPAFQAAARPANLRAAADALHLTHSAVSQQIRVLETQLGFEVFERAACGIEHYAPAAVDGALHQLDEGVASAAVATRGSSQRWANDGSTVTRSCVPAPRVAAVADATPSSS